MRLRVGEDVLYRVAAVVRAEQDGLVELAGAFEDEPADPGPEPKPRLTPAGEALALSLGEDPSSLAGLKAVLAAAGLADLEDARAELGAVMREQEELRERFRERGIPEGARAPRAVRRGGLI